MCHAYSCTAFGDYPNWAGDRWTSRVRKSALRDGCPCPTMSGGGFFTGSLCHAAVQLTDEIYAHLPGSAPIGEWARIDLGGTKNITCRPIKLHDHKSGSNTTACHGYLSPIPYFFPRRKEWTTGHRQEQPVTGFIRTFIRLNEPLRAVI